jgi:hypothetical protein
MRYRNAAEGSQISIKWQPNNGIWLSKHQDWACKHTPWQFNPQDVRIRKQFLAHDLPDARIVHQSDGTEYWANS